MPRKKAEITNEVKVKKPKKTKIAPVKKSVFIELSPDKYFVLCNGDTIKDYKELAAILETIGDDIFYYHVTNERNDFANWINDVFEEKELAEKIRQSRSRHEMMAILYKHLFHKLEGLCA
jgi:hypothetical protein